MLPDPVCIVGEILALCKKIHEAAGAVEANKKQCKRLADRILIAQQALEKLSEKELQAIALPAITQLASHLGECEQFIASFSKKRWYRKALRARQDDEQFQQLNRDLQTDILQLNLGINIQTLFKHDDDQRDREFDQQELLRRQDEIMQLNQDTLKEVRQTRISSVEANTILSQQMASLLRQFAYIKASLQQKQPNALPLAARHLINFCEIMFERKLSSQHFDVYSGNWQGKPVAIKVLPGKLSHEDKAYKIFVRDMQILAKLRHVNIIQFYGACLEDDTLCYITELAEQGSLVNCLAKQASLSDRQRHNIALAIAQGLQYLHHHPTGQILHRNLKSSKILLTEAGVAKIAGFSVAKVQDGAIATAGQLGNDYVYLPPELLHAEAYTSASDIYSFGVILLELFTGKVALKEWSERDILKLKEERKLLPIPSSLPQAYQQLIKDCWHSDSTQRPDISTVLQRLQQASVTLSDKAQTIFNQGLEHEKCKEYDRALACYSSAHKEGHMRATTNLAMFYLMGIAVPADKVKAYSLFLQSAQQGHPRAQYNLSLMLLNGDGVAKDSRQAVDWLKRASDSGDAPSGEMLRQLGTT